MENVRLNSDGSIDGVPVSDKAALLTRLALQVELGSGYTLRSFFRMLETHGTLVYLNPFLPDLLDQYHQGADSGCRVDGIDCLVLEKTVEMIGFPGQPRLEIYRSFCGRSPNGQSVQIKEFQVDMLLDTPVCLGKLKHVVFGDQVDVFEFDTVFTLFELVEGIGWELGFHGTPRECQIGSVQEQADLVEIEACHTFLRSRIVESCEEKMESIMQISGKLAIDGWAPHKEIAYV